MLRGIVQRLLWVARINHGRWIVVAVEARLTVVVARKVSRVSAVVDV